MLGIHDYWLFVLTGVLLNLTPGQDTMFILGRSLTGGLRSGVASALGIGVGSIVHTLAAAAGLSVLLAASPAAFLVVRVFGALYLIYLGTKLLLTAHQSTDGEITPVEQGSAWSAFRQGILTNLLNPKVALFFLALLPQFIDPASRAKTLAFLMLGLTFVTTGTLWCLVLAFGAACLRRLFRDNPQARTIIDRVSGGLFIVLGVRLATDP